MKQLWLFAIFGLIPGLIEARFLDGYGKLFGKCSKEINTFECFKMKILEILDNAIKDESIYVLNDFISISKDTKVLKKLWIPENSTKRSLDDQLDMKFQEYLSSRSIKLTIPGEVFEGIQFLKIFE